jgi:short-subunit dehydrogenase
MKIELFGKRALVTGASSGIGRALAKALARENVWVAVSGRRQAALDSLADEIERAGGTRPAVLPADLSKRGEAHRLGERAIEALGQVDLLVNNAGVGIGGSQVVVADDDVARELFETNYWSALALTRALVPGMRARNAGAIVNVSSIGSITPMPLAGHYSSSKAALSLATETLRLELRDTDLHVLHVLPGPVDTAMLAEFALVPGGDKVLAGMPKGDVDTLAQKIIRGLERRKRAFVYPTMLAAIRHLPTVFVRMAARAGRAVDVNDTRKLMGGSSGDVLAIEARKKFDAVNG